MTDGDPAQACRYVFFLSRSPHLQLAMFPADHTDTEPDRAVWRMSMPDQIYCDAMCAWLARRCEQWDAWGQLAEREGANVLHLWLAELAKAEPLVPPKRIVITKVADGRSVAFRDDLPEPHISLSTVYRFTTGADRNLFYAWLAEGDPVRRPFDLARIWWLTGNDGLADALHHLTVLLRAGGAASS